MKNNLIPAFILLLVSAGLGASEPKPYQLPRTHVLPVRDSESGRQYELVVKLPDGYAEQKELKHPVIYFTDAAWHIGILAGAAEYLMDQAILVGISWQKDASADLKEEVGPHVSRFQDYTVRKSDDPGIQAKYQLGQASKHLRFIRDDVIKAIESNYRADPERRSYFGYSLGALFGACILMVQPDTFDSYILGSPSLDSELPYFSELASNAAIRSNALDASVFISHGSLETALSEDIKEFISLLDGRNDESLSLTYAVIEGSHKTAFPATGVRGVAWLAAGDSE